MWSRLSVTSDLDAECVGRCSTALSSASPTAAEAVTRAVATIRASMKILAASPRIGRPAEDMDPDYREKLIDFGNSGYVALYRLNGETVVILAVRHQKEAGYHSR